MDEEHSQVSVAALFISHYKLAPQFPKKGIEVKRVFFYTIYVQNAVLLTERRYLGTALKDCSFTRDLCLLTNCWNTRIYVISIFQWGSYLVVWAKYGLGPGGFGLVW